MEYSSPVPEDDEEGEAPRYVYFRGRPLRTTGKSRSRHDAYDNHIQIDYSRSLAENIKAALAGSLTICMEERTANKQIRLTHLNNLSRLAEKYARERIQLPVNAQDSLPAQSIRLVASDGPVSVTLEQLLLCLRCLLTDDEREIRAAALRVLRYLIQSDDDLVIALRLHLDILIARCLDVVLDNRIERMQCIRLLVSLIDHCPSTFPASLVQCLLALCLDGYEEKEKMAPAATAALCELVIRNPDLILHCGGLRWLVRAVLIGGQSTARLAECLTTVLASIYNLPRNRQRFGTHLRNVFQDIMAPLMDEYFRISGMDVEDKTAQIKAEADQVIENSKAAVVAALRSWPGIVGCLSFTTGNGNGGFLPSPIYTLVASLCVDSAKTREFAVDAICEVMNVPYHRESINSWEKALEIKDSLPLEEYIYSLSQQFVNADADSVLDEWNKTKRLNLTDQTKALILIGLVDAGLINAMIGVITANPSGAVELKMTLLLSDMLQMCGRWLPSIYRQLSLSMSSLLHLIYDVSMDEDDSMRSLVSTPSEIQRQNATVLAHRLHVLSRRQDQPKRIRTLQLENLMAKYAPSYEAVQSGSVESAAPNPDKNAPRSSTMKSTSSTTSMVRMVAGAAEGRAQSKASVDRVHDLIRDSRTTVPYSNHTAWDWSLIYLALCQICQYRHHIEDSTCAKFTGLLIQFFDPAGGQFCKMTDDYSLYSRVGCVLMHVIGSATMDSMMSAQLKTFLTHLAPNLLLDRLHVGLLSPKNVMNNSCADYFAFVGQLSDTETGRSVLEKTGITQRVIDLLNKDAHDAYVKLVLSSMLDYDRPGIGRVLIQKAATSSKDTGRVYATKFLSVLGKLKVAQFGDWGMELLINQLRDKNRAVVEEALYIIEELINEEEYLDSLIRLRPSLLPLGDAGVLLLTYIMGNEQAVSSLIKQCTGQSKRYSIPKDESRTRSSSPQLVGAHFVGKEIERWKSTFNERYTRIVDERLCEAFSSYKRMPDGSFPRHASTSVQPISDVYLPPHLYGQLARHPVGCELLHAYDCLEPMLNVLHAGPLETEQEILEMKSALWALGHVCSTESGYRLLPAAMVASLVKMAEECPVLSVRGCAFYVINLVAQSCPIVRDRLRKLAWEATPPFPTVPMAPQRKRNRGDLVRDQSQAEPRDDETVNDGDFNPGSLLSASVASGGDVFSSTSGSSPPRATPPSITLLYTSPGASRKSSQARSCIRSVHSHYSSGTDARSILTCASCELCRSIAPGGGSGTVQNGDQPSGPAPTCSCNFAQVASPIKILCCDTALQEGQECTRGRLNSRRVSFGSAVPTFGSSVPTFGSTVPTYGSNVPTSVSAVPMFGSTVPTCGSTVPTCGSTVPTCGSTVPACGSAVPTIQGASIDGGRTVPTMQRPSTPMDVQVTPVGGKTLLPLISKRQSTPSPRRSPSDMETRKISVPARLEACDYGDFTDQLKNGVTISDLPDIQGIATSNGAYPTRLRVTAPSNYGFFTRIEKKLDSRSDLMRSAFGLRKAPMIAQDLPRVMFRGSMGERSLQTAQESDPDYVAGGSAGGFATWRRLQNIQWERAASLDAVISFTDAPIGDEPGLNTAIVMEDYLARDEEMTSQITTGTTFQEDDESISALDAKSRLCPSNEKPIFMCLPLDIGLLCNVTDWPSESESDSTSKSVNDVQSHYPAIDHMVDQCLHCRPFTSKDAVQSPTQDQYDITKHAGETGEKAAEKAGAKTSATSDYIAAQSPFRKELLRLVTLLSVRKKYAEQGLLRLKQEAPQLFRSLCIYCDVSYVMSMFTFRLSARRFLQELFQDVDFGALWTEPRRIMLDHHHHHSRAPSAPAAPLT